MKKLSLSLFAICLFGAISCGSKQPASPAKTKQNSAAATAAQTTIDSKNDPGRYVRTTPSPAPFKITNPKTAEEHFDVAVYQQMHHNLDTAIDEYKKAIALKPNWAIAHYRLGVLYDKKQNRDAAIAEWKEAIRADPHYLDAYNDLTVAYKERGDLRTASEYYEHLLEYPPARTMVHYRLGFWYKQLGDNQKAQDHLEKYIDLALNAKSKEAGTDRYQKAVGALKELKARG